MASTTSRRIAFPRPMAAAAGGVLLALTLSAAEPEGGAPAVVQPASPPATNANGLPTFPVLSEIERHQKELEERRFESKRRNQLNDIQRLIQLAQLKPTPDEQILTLLRAEKLLRDMLEERRDPAVLALMQRVRAAAVSVPPPRVFRNAAGLEMMLVDNGQDPPFYISRAPITRVQLEALRRTTAAAVDGAAEAGAAKSEAVRTAAVAGAEAESAADVPCAAAHAEAVAFCQWLTRGTADRYELPTVDQLRIYRPRSSVALWTMTEWQGPSEQVWKQRSRFAVRMYGVWNTAKVFPVEPEVFGELPHATYPQLGFMVVTGVGTGMENRLRRLRLEL